MKLLVVNEFAFDQYAPSFCRALRTAGAEVEELHVGPRRRLDVLRRAQMKYVAGPEVWAANLAVLLACARKRPHVVLAWTTPWLYLSTMRAIRSWGVRIALYNNDDPFGPDRDSPRWRAFRRTIPGADICFAYRTVNLQEYRAAGAPQARLLPSWYDSARDRPVALSDRDLARFASDVTFAGHYEDDGREHYIDALVSAGLQVRIFGSGKLWDPVVRRMGWEAIGPVYPAEGEDYARAIAATKLGLVFLSARNRDTYTRRCFEIPAIGTAMIAPRSETLRSMFVEDKEAIFYDSPAELAAKAVRYIRDDVTRARIASAGHDRCVRDGHDVVSRAKQFLADLQSGLAL
jgi:hypothetical protein